MRSVPLPSVAAPISAERLSLARLGVVVLPLFALHLLLSVALVRLQIGGLPVRILPGALALVLCIALAPRTFQLALARVRSILLIITAAAILGVVVSAAAGERFPVVGRQLLEIHAQAAFAVLLGSVMVQVWGVRRICLIFIGVIGSSAVFAVAQGMGLQAAHDVWFSLQTLQPRPTGAEVETTLSRPAGLSYTPVLLGTQVCLAFCALWACFSGAWNGGRIAFRWSILLAVACVLFVCIITGNRSPTLGIIVFTALYLLVSSHASALLVAAACLIFLPLLPALQDLAETTGLRVANTTDGAALSRTVLREFGIQLFLERPQGYGLGFDSRDLWASHWEDLQTLPSSQAMRSYSVHNYYLLALNKYGVVSLALLLSTLPALIASWRIALPFTAYCIHIYYHNDGPLQSDFLFWYVAVALVYAWSEAGGRTKPAAPGAVR